MTSANVEEHQTAMRPKLLIAFSLDTLSPSVCRHNFVPCQVVLNGVILVDIETFFAEITTWNTVSRSFQSRKSVCLLQECEPTPARTRAGPY
eukprot:5868334-Amphidinium_carterae.1